MDPLSVASSIAGLITLVDVIYGRIVKFVKTAHGAQKEVSALFAEINGLYGILRGVEAVFTRFGTEQLRSSTYQAKNRVS